MEKSSTVSKLVKVVIAIVVLVVVVALMFKAIPFVLSFFTQTNKTPQLNKVTDVQYNDSTCVLTWSQTENSDGYNVSINGKTQLVTDTQLFFVPTQLTTEFKVQAVDSTGNYTSSDWSETITYTVEQDQVTYASVNAFVGSMLTTDYRLMKVINVSIKDDKVYTTAVYKRNDEIKVYELSTEYDFEIESLSDVLGQNGYDRILDKYPLANYDSASSLLKSNSYAGQMEEYRQQGYTFEVISQVVGEYYENDSAYKIYATYKLHKGEDIRYLNVVSLINIKETSSNEKTNYTTKLENPEDRYLYELSCYELTGDQIDFVKEIERLEIPLVMEIEEEEPNYSGSSGYIFRFPSTEMLFNV